MSWQTAFSRLKNLDLYEANDPQELGSVYGKSILTLESDIICDNISQHPNGEFEIKGSEYLIDEKDLDDLPSQSVDAHLKNHSSSPFICNLCMTKVKQLLQIFVGLWHWVAVPLIIPNE